jgi:hypothetical protein
VLGATPLEDSKLGDNIDASTAAVAVDLQWTAAGQVDSETQGCWCTMFTRCWLGLGLSSTF